MNSDWLQLAQFVFVALAFLLCGATLIQAHTRWLGVLFAAIGLHGALAGLQFLANTPLGRYSYALVLCYGPLFYLALRSLMRQEPPGAAAGVCLAGLAFLGVLLIAAGTVAGSGLGIITTVVQLAAIIAAYREVRAHEAVMEQARSAAAGPALRWIWSALGFYSVVVVVLSLRAALSWTLPPDLRNALNLLIAMAIGVVLSTLTVRILANPGWIPRTTAAERALAAEQAESPPSAGDPTPEQLGRYQELERRLGESRAFLDPDLTVKTLAAQLGWTSRQLSEVINRVDRCSFSHKINRLRVEEAKRLLAAPGGAERTLLDIALDSGFNSKSAFNLMFKRFAGATPKAFREQAKKMTS